MKNILITGGAGFIGTNLAERLLQDGNKVFIIDDLSTGRIENLTYLYEKSPAVDNKLKFCKVDIVSDNFLKMKFPWKFDEIYHLACPASPPKYYIDPLKTLDTNYIGTKNVLELARHEKARILFTSTSEVYGDPVVPTQSEDYNGNVNPVSPRSVYDEGKRVAETLVSEYHRQFGLETKIARIFNTFGPRMDPDDGRVVTNLIKQFLENKPFTIYGSGNQTRSFCFISDQVDGLILLMNSEKFINEPVNIGSHYEIPIKTLSGFISNLLDYPIEYKPMPISDPLQRRADVSKMQSLGWNPKFTPLKLQQELELTKEYMKKEMGIK